MLNFFSFILELIQGNPAMFFFSLRLQIFQYVQLSEKVNMERPQTFVYSKFELTFFTLITYQKWHNSYLSVVSIKILYAKVNTFFQRNISEKSFLVKTNYDRIWIKFFIFFQESKTNPNFTKLNVGAFISDKIGGKYFGNLLEIWNYVL